MKKWFIGLVLLLSVVSLSAQETLKPCSLPEFSQFDFWVGEWDLSWSDSMHASNSITKKYNDCVLLEQFDGAKYAQFSGMSVTTYDVRAKAWKQTWVDDQGSYLDFVGNMVADSMIMSRSYMRNDSTFYQRMVWYDIKDDSFTWNWEKRSDVNAPWDLAWQIFYKRK